MSRLYAIESLFTLTGASADHRLRVAASLVGQIAETISTYCQPHPVPAPTTFESKWAHECANDLLAAGKNALVVAGQRQPIEVHLLAHAINSALGAIGNTITLHAVPEQNERTVTELNEALKADQVNSLVILGGNPAYNAPDSNTSENFNHIGINYKGRRYSLLRLGFYEDETFLESVNNWHFPATHYLESWGDATTSNGTLVPIQPLVQPLFGGLTELEFLARLAGESQTNPYEIVRQTSFAIFKKDWIAPEEVWKEFLFSGFLNGSSPKPATLPIDQLMVTPKLPQIAAPTANSVEVIFYRDSKVDDGRYANNGWMQELPDPVTKMTWDNAVLVSRKTAKELGVANGDMVEITLNGRKVTGPIWTQPGMADYSLGLALGYGREKAGRVGGDAKNTVGFNAYKIFSGKYIETGATVKKTGETHVLACTQHHWSMEGRPAVREANLEEFQTKPDFAQEMHDKEPPVVAPLYPNPFDEAKKTAAHQWGLVVDLNSCVGCGTCVVACQSENNIPIVGKDQVGRGREMHWMRIDRYYTSDPKRKHNPSLFDPKADENLTDAEQQFAEWIDDVQAVNQPMLCQMCEAAPCENVCPVNATSHDAEGLNVMTYNRCIGTRYCSNNCPYKVRRFNYFDYNKRPISALTGPFYPTPLTHKTDGKRDLLSWFKAPDASGMREEDEWDLIKMVKNPERDGANARRDGKMHLLHPAHPAGGNHAEGQGRCVRRHPPEGIRRHDSENGVPAGVSGGRDCVRRHQRSGQRGFKMEGAAAELFRARRVADQAAHDLLGARPQSESEYAGLSARTIQHGGI